jgi:hypothetical protein
MFTPAQNLYLKILSITLLTGEGKRGRWWGGGTQLTGKEDAPGLPATLPILHALHAACLNDKNQEALLTSPVRPPIEYVRNSYTYLSDTEINELKCVNIGSLLAASFHTGWGGTAGAQEACRALAAALVGAEPGAALEALRVLHVCTSFPPARKLLAAHVKDHPATLHAVLAMAAQVCLPSLRVLHVCTSFPPARKPWVFGVSPFTHCFSTGMVRSDAPGAVQESASPASCFFCLGISFFHRPEPAFLWRLDANPTTGTHQYAHSTLRGLMSGALGQCRRI